jgi:hypothetical protein
LCFGELGWTRERYLKSTIEEFSFAIAGYWRNWERQQVWLAREVIFAMIAGNPNIESSKKPKKEDLYRLSDDKKVVVKKSKPMPQEKIDKLINLLK